MRRMFDEMVNFDNTLDRFEELCRHGYSFERMLNKMENENDYYSDDEDYSYWE